MARGIPGASGELKAYRTVSVVRRDAARESRRPMTHQEWQRMSEGPAVAHYWRRLPPERAAA